MEIHGGFHLLALEAPNYLLIAHATVCVGKLAWDFSSCVDAPWGKYCKIYIIYCLFFVSDALTSTLTKFYIF